MNNNENNEGLNSFSLGNIDNTGVPNPQVPQENGNVSPVSEVDSIGMDSLDVPPSPHLDSSPNMDTPQPVNPIPEPTQTIPDLNQVPPVAPAAYDVPQPINDLNTTPFMNDIGTVPPIPDTPVVGAPSIEEPSKPKKKSGVPKPLFILIVVLALAAVGVGVYIILGMSRRSISVVTKNVEIEINGEVSNNITDYATFSGIDSSSCSLDTSAIEDTSELGKEYNFIITCKDTKYTGTATIVDSVAPDVSTKPLSVGLNENVVAGDFIDGDCKDETECTYSFKDEEKVKEYLAKEGTYTDVVIVIRDEAGNETEKIVTLEVNSTLASLYLNCQKDVNGYSEITKLGLNNQNLFNKTGIKTYTFKLTSETYNTLKAENQDKETMTYQNLTGKPTFNDEELTLVLSRNVTYEELSSEVNGTIPEAYGELRDFYGNMGYACTIGY